MLLAKLVDSPSSGSNLRLDGPSSAERTDERYNERFVVSLRTKKVKASPTFSPKPTNLPLALAKLDGKLTEVLYDSASAVAK